MEVVTTLFAVAAAGAVAVVLVKRRRAGVRTQRDKPGWGPWHCVSVRPSRPACAAVLRLRDLRFLPAEAPIFPVSECDVPRCDCRYEHHADRRHRQRRKVDADMSRAQHRGPDRRSTSRGRRASDYP